MWPLRVAGLNPSLDPGGIQALFSRKDGEVGEKDAKLLRSAGRAGFKCNFISLHLRAVLKSQCKSFIIRVYFQNIFDY